MSKKDLLSKLAQAYQEETKPILFPSDIPIQDVEAIAREIVSIIESYDVNIDKRELEKLSKEIAEGYLFELEVDKLINKTFEEIKKKENLDENITLDKFIEEKEGWEIFGKYLKETNKRWEKILEKEPKNLEKYGTFIMFQAMQSLSLMREHAKFLKNPSEIEKDAINSVKSKKVFREFLISLIEAKKNENKNKVIQKAAQTQEDFEKFAMSSIKEIDLRTEIEEDELDEVKQYTDALKYKLITIFKNTKHLSQETIESIEKLKQELIKDTPKLDANNTLKDAIGHTIKLKVEIKNHIEYFNQEIEREQKLINNIKTEAEEDKISKNNILSLQETLKSLKNSSKRESDKTNPIYKPIEIVNLYRIAYKDNKLKNLNKYIAYSWIYNIKAFKTTRRKLMKKLSELLARKDISSEKKHKKK